MQQDNTSPSLPADFEAVTVRYGGVLALSNASFSLRPGESLAVLGLNGAGKTTAIRALLGMLRPQEGRVSLFGEKPGRPALLRRVGFVPEDAAVPGFLNGGEYLELIAQLSGETRAAAREQSVALLDWFDLPHKERVRGYSKGMRKRLLLAQAFLGTRDLLILDEPLNGLDPVLIVRLRERLQQFRSRGGSVLYCSHLLAEVEHSCDRAIFLRRGVLVHSDTLANLTAEHGSLEKAFLRYAAEA